MGRKNQAESGNMIRLTVTQGSFVSPCGIQETVIVLECSTVKVVAPWKTGSSCSVLWGRQISAIINNCINTVVSETPHELANQFVKPNVLMYGVELVLEVKLQQNSLNQENVLLNQGQKVASLSDRGYELRSEVCDMVTSQLSWEPANNCVHSQLAYEPVSSCIPNSCSTIWGSGAKVELCVYGASRLKWFPLESERCPVSIKQMGSEVVRVLSVEGWSQSSIKPMGSGCAMISGTKTGVLGLVVIQGQPSVCGQWTTCGQWTMCGQWTTCSQLSRTSNFSEEFESGNGVNVRTGSHWPSELAVSVSPGGPEPSAAVTNYPTVSVAQPYACGDTRGKDNLPLQVSFSRSSRTNTPLASTICGTKGFDSARR